MRRRPPAACPHGHDAILTECTLTDRYWETEVIYVILSLTSKLYLGGLMYSSVLVQASFAAALADDD